MFVPISILCKNRYLIEPEAKNQDSQNIAIVNSGCSLYDKGSLSCSNQEWYHGELTRVEAEQALADSGCDCFLIREDEGGLVLSLTYHGQVNHVAIKYGPGWYGLEGDSVQHRFTELDDLVSYYCSSNNIRFTLESCQKINTTGSNYTGVTTSSPTDK